MTNRKLKNLYYDNRNGFQVLGCLMKNPKLIKDKKYQLSTQDFVEPLHKYIFGAIYNLIVQDLAQITPIEIETYLSNTSPKHHKVVFEDNDGFDWLEKAVDPEIVKLTNFDYQYNRLKKFTLLRNYIEEGFDVSEILDQNEIDVGNIESQNEDFNEMSIEDITKYFDKKILKVKSGMNHESESQSKKAGDNAEQIKESLKTESPYGALTRSGYYNSVTRGLQRGKFFVESGGTGCVDGDTEYFNGREWIRIADYQEGDKVLQFNSDDWSASLTKPKEYIKLEEDSFYHIRNMSGTVDQLLSEEHNIAYVTSKGNMKKINTMDYIEKYNSNPKGCKFGFLNAFNYDGGKGIDLSDEMIRLMVAIFADGNYNQESRPSWTNYYTCRVNLKKQRKKDRLEKLLEEANVPYRKKDSSVEGYHTYYFKTQGSRQKTFPTEWYEATPKQLEIIFEELLLWDGRIGAKGRRSFSTTIKSDADFAQFVGSSLGYTSNVSVNDRVGQEYETCGKIYKRKSIEYSVHFSKKKFRQTSLYCPNNINNKLRIEKVKSKDGYKYCFTVETGYLVLRRNNKIFVTGNSGKSRTTLARMAEVCAVELWDYETETFLPNPNNPDGELSCAYVGIELDLDNEVEQILWAVISGVPTERIIENTYEEGEEERVDYAIQVLKRSKIYLYDNPNYGMQYIDQICEKHTTEDENFFGLFLDYIAITGEIMQEFSAQRKNMAIREDMIYLWISSECKKKAKKYDIFFGSSTQLNVKSTDAGKEKDASLIRGSFALVDKADLGKIFAKPTAKELERVDDIIKKIGGFGKPKPNRVEHIFKSRGTKYKEVRIFQHVDLGTMQITDLFVTDYDFKQIDIDPRYAM